MVKYMKTNIHAISYAEKTGAIEDFIVLINHEGRSLPGNWLNGNTSDTQ